MNELPSKGREPYYAETELAPLQESGDQELCRLAQLLKRALPAVESGLSAFRLQENGGAGLCEFATHALHERLKQEGFCAKMLAGDVVVGPQDSLEHLVNLVETAEHWAVIDLTVDQIRKHKHEHYLIRVMDPTDEALRRMLKEEYNWWIPVTS